MAVVVHLSDAVRTAMCNAAVDLLDAGSGAGKILYYDGTIPASVATAVGTQNLLGTHTFSDPAFDAADAGTASIGTVTGANAIYTSTATWARLTDSDDVAVIDLSVGVSGAAINLETTSFTSGTAIPVIVSGAFTMPSGA